MLFLEVLLKKQNSFLKKGLKAVACFAVAFYKSFISGTLGSGGCCRFYPSCGDYAFFIYKKYSFFKATKLVLLRVLSCHPLGPKWRDEPFFEA